MRASVRILLFLAIAVGGCARDVAVTGDQPRPLGAMPMTVIGLCEDYPEESRSLADAERDLNLLRSCRVSHLRVALGWDGIETEPDKFDWAFWDAFFDLAEKRQITLLPYVCYTPKWAAVSDENHWRQPPKDMAAFGRFMEAAATRYRGRTKSWELWNEPDNAEYWEGTREDFAKLIKAGAAAVRKADPSARIVLGGIAWETDFVAEMLATYGIADHVDVINLHSYFETWSPDPIESIPAMVNRVADLIAEHGDGEAIWMAEVGYSNYRKNGHVSPAYTARYVYEHTAEHQAEALVRTMALLLSTGKVELAAWYRINDLPATQDIIGDVNNRHLGLLDTAGRPKPALEAMKLVATTFGPAVRCIDREVRIERHIDSDLRVHAFERADGRLVLVAWLQTNVPGRGSRADGKATDDRKESAVITLPRRYLLQPKAQPSQVRMDDLGRIEITVPAGTTAIVEFAPR